MEPDRLLKWKCVAGQDGWMVGWRELEKGANQGCSTLMATDWRVSGAHKTAAWTLLTFEFQCIAVVT